MKVLSLTEPYATLIKEKKKWIETRSWKTDYRGELYIHASSTKIPKNWKDNTELFTLIENTPLNFGNIICKCNLVDCIYMTKEYVENMKEKNHQEYICGDYREGRYAWILDNITPILPIKATGSLSIWNYYTEKEIMSFLEQIEYGWVDDEKKKHLTIDETFSKKYRLQSPKEIIENKIGVCWDQVELERYYFKGYQNIKTYFIVHYDNDKCPTHTFLTYQKDNKYYWFEHAWEKWKGIHEYSSLEELLLDVKEKFILDELKNNYNKNNLCLYEYKKPKSNITVEEYYKHCEQGKKIK